MHNQSLVFLHEIGRIAIGIDAEFSDEDLKRALLAWLFPNENDERIASQLLNEQKYQKIIVRMIRHASSAMAFHILTLVDERKELGEWPIRPKLVFMQDREEVDAPNNLHELLGDAMSDMEMDTNDWW